MSNEKQQGFLLSILIPTMPSREGFLQRLMGVLEPQLAPDIELLVDSEIGVSIGVKRQQMLEAAQGKYIAFIDDDDLISANYVALLREGMAKDVDCCSLRGVITTDGYNPKPFHHSNVYTELDEVDGLYRRPPNHLNCIKREHALAAGFPDARFGEDSQYALRLMGLRVLKTQHEINEVVYRYEYISNKPTFQQR